MSIYQRRGIWHYDFNVGGHRHYGSTGQRERGKALSVEAIKRTEALERKLPPALRKVPKLADYAARFLKDVDAEEEAGHLAHKTALYYSNGVRLLAETPVWQLRLEQITGDVGARLQFSSASNGNNALRTLRHMLHRAERAGLIYRAPQLKLLEENERTAIIEPWLEELMLEHAREPLRTAMIFQLDAFLRPAEIMAMRWEDVSWAHNQVFIPKGKTRRSRRHIGLTSRMQSALQSLRPSGATSGWVFPSVRLKSRHSSACGHTLASSLDKMWKALKARVTAKVRETDPDWQWPAGLVLYSCKHTGLTAYSGEVGSNQLKVAAAAGHSDLRTTRRYVHHSDDASGVMEQVQERRLKVIDGKKRA